MRRREFLRRGALAAAGCALGGARRGAAAEAQRPNIVYILCDDLGYGDVHCLNPQRGKIATPHLDRLASEGLVFTDAHSGSSVCSPTRYGILTGRYSWRTRLQNGVLMGFSPPLIAADRLTVPKLLGQHGYHSACIGKWHLGMDMPKRPGAKAEDEVDGGQRIGDGPTTRGFDYYFGISASLDMPPFAFIEQDRFTQAPTVTKKWVRSGPAAPDFEAIDVLPTLTRKATEYIAARAAARQPFLLYLALASPHTPIVPSKEWQGKSGLGAYGDFVTETDWALGEVVEALAKAGIADNTLLIFTSDNGCSPAAGVGQLEAQGHFPSANLRGYKADIWDGGHRIPFLARWPQAIKPGTVCDQTVCLTDLLATSAELVGAKLPANAGEDSVSIVPLLKGGRQPVREATVHHSIGGLFAIRQGPWKLEFCPGSGGWAQPRDPEARRQGLPALQLYHLERDLGEQRNLQADEPAVVERLTKLLEQYVTNGRSTPGAPQRNDVAVDFRKTPGRGR